MKKSLDSRISRLIIWIEVALVLCLAAIWYFGFHGKSHKDVAGSGELRVLTRNASTTYFQSQGEPRGFEYELIQAFARENGRRVRVIVKNSLQAVLEGMKNGEGDIAAAGLLQTESLAKEFRIGPVYRRVSQQVVCRNDRTLPTGPDDLTGLRLVVARGSAHEELLTRWQSRLPALTWESSEGKSEEQLLATVDEGEIDCTLAESTLVAANRRIHHHLRVAFDASGPRQVVWLVRKDNEQLAKAVQSWFQKVRVNGLLSALEDRTFGHLASYDLRDLEVFQQRIVERLPAYRELFEAAARDVGLPWTLLAAQAYQESHWDADATSPTGVKGIMMLTRSTAKSLGVVDRTDPRQSIPAGAHYLRQLLDSLPQELYRRDRVNQALAAYTLGLKHVRQARRLTESEGRDPRLWSPVKHSLLQLSQQTQEGHSAKRRPAGKAAVRYVHRIRNYEDVLRHSVDM